MSSQVDKLGAVIRQLLANAEKPLDNFDKEVYQLNQQNYFVFVNGPIDGSSNVIHIAGDINDSSVSAGRANRTINEKTVVDRDGRSAIKSELKSLLEILSRLESTRIHEVILAMVSAINADDCMERALDNVMLAMESHEDAVVIQKYLRSVLLWLEA